jgi:hypothetical protein
MKALDRSFIYRLNKYFFLFTITFFPAFTNAQITFERLYGGTNSETAYKVEICNDGGYITAGFTRSQGPGFANMHLIRTSQYGELLWEFVEGGDLLDRAYSVSANNDGSFVAVGVTTSFGAGQEDIMVVKVDSSGKKLWRKTFGGIQAEEAWDVRETDDGGYIITGYTNSFGAQLFDAFLLKLDKNGNQKWMKLYGGGLFDGGYCVRQTTDGGYAMLGQTLSQGKKGLFYFVKTDSSGEKIWERTFGGEEEDEGRYFSLTDDGGYILMGKTQSKGAGDDDFYVIKVSSNGNLQWESTYGGDKKDTGKSIEPTQDGGYIMIGSSRSFNWLVPRVWIMKIDNTGNPIWERNIGTWNHDHGHHILPTDDGGYIATGHYNRVAAKAEDTYLLKLDKIGNYNANATDAAVLEIIRPLSEDCSSQKGIVTIKVKNTGNKVINSIQLKAEITGSINKTLNQTFPVVLQVFQEYNFSFTETLNTTGGGEISILATVTVSNDANTENNSLEKTIKISQNEAPTVDLGADITIPGGSPSIELDAGANFSAYLWSTGEKTRKIKAEDSNNYWVEVKDDNGCFASDTINVLFTNINEIADLSAVLKVFPNPSDGMVAISLESESKEVFELQLYNFYGQLMFSRQVSTVGGSIDQKIDFTGFPQGIYLLRLSDGKYKATAKFILK